MDPQTKTYTPDGRTLDVYVDGPEGAVPLLFHNGTPSSGQLYAPFVEAASQRGLRLVSFSRAEYGSSTRNPGRSVADVVPDVTAVLDQLGANRFYTLGWSGGGPHALACAALLPARLIGAATVGGWRPMTQKAWTGWPAWARRMSRGSALPWPAKPSCGPSSRMSVRRSRPSPPTRSRRGLATWSRTSTARRSPARQQPGWRTSSGSQCGTGSGAGMTMSSRL